MINLNFKHLYYFWIIAKKGGIKQAAEKLHLSQSTLSDQLRNLEEYLGQALFERRSRSLFLTPFGEQTLEYATRLFQLGEEMLMNLGKKDQPRTTILRMGIAPTLAKNMIFTFVMPLLKHEELQIRVTEGEPTLLYRELSLGNLDLVFSEQVQLTHVKAIHTKKLFDRSFYAVYGPQYEEQIGKDFSRLSQLPFINYSRETDLHFHCNEVLVKRKITSRLAGEMDDVKLMAQAVEEGFCWCILPKRALLESVRENKVVVLEKLGEIRSSIYVSSTTDRFDAYLAEIEERIKATDLNLMAF